MTLHYHRTEQDLLDYQLHIIEKSPATKKQRRTLLLLPPFIIIILAFITFSITDYNPKAFIPALAFSAYWIITLLLTREKTTRNSLLANIRQTGTDRVYGPYTLTLAEDGLHSTSPLGTAHTHWHAILSTDLTPRYLFINLAGNQGYPILVETIGQETAQAAQQYIQQKITTPPPLPTT